MELKQGIYPDIPNDKYHGMKEYVSNSYLSNLNKCPAAAKVDQETTDAMVFGTACHCYILEGEQVFNQQFAVAPAGIDKRTKDGKAIYAAFELANQGKTVISEANYDVIVSMSKAVHDHPFAKAILADGLSEQTVVWQDEETGIWCKCRPDRIPSGGKGILVDLKTTSDAGEYAFGKSVANYGYARQASMYLDGVNAATGSAFDAFVFVAVEKTAPYRVETYLLDEEFIDYGRREYKRLLNVELNCRAAGKYPNRQTDDLVVLYKPNYL